MLKEIDQSHTHPQRQVQPSEHSNQGQPPNVHCDFAEQCQQSIAYLHHCLTIHFEGEHPGLT